MTSYTITETAGETEIDCKTCKNTGWITCKHPAGERFDYDGDPWCSVCDEGTEGNPAVRTWCCCQTALD
jgi:hypothetical protein